MSSLWVQKVKSRQYNRKSNRWTEVSRSMASVSFKELTDYVTNGVISKRRAKARTELNRRRLAV